MQRERGELVPIGDALSGMGGTVQAIRDATPQALHHFTQADQVHQLVSASEANPDLGFMARMPRSDRTRAGVLPMEARRRPPSRAKPRRSTASGACTSAAAQITGMAERNLSARPHGLNPPPFPS